MAMYIHSVLATISPSWGAPLLLLFKPSLNARVGALGWNCILRHFSAQSIPTTLHHPPPPFPIAHLTLAPPSSPLALSPICAANWRRPPLVLVRFPNQHASWLLWCLCWWNATIVVKKEKVNEWKITKNYCSSHKNSLKPILEVCHTLKRLNH